MLKAVREAKAYSSWINPRTEYEDAVTGFVRGLIGPAGNKRFLTSFLTFQKRIARHGIWNSLSQVLLKLTVPGVPDIYQGTESWDFSLVDPDNRRKVNYQTRQAMLTALQQEFEGPREEVAGKARQLLDTAKDGRIKLYLLWKTLMLRREHELLFRDGDYQPLKVSGRRADHVCAYLRQHGALSIIVLAPRLFLPLTRRESGLPIGQNVWRDTVIEIPALLSASKWCNIFTGETHSPYKYEEGAAIELAAVFRHFPYGLLVAGDD